MIFKSTILLDKYYSMNNQAKETVHDCQVTAFVALSLEFEKICPQSKQNLNLSSAIMKDLEGEKNIAERTQLLKFLHSSL